MSANNSLKEWEPVMVAVILVGVLILVYIALKEQGFNFSVSKDGMHGDGEGHALRFQSKPDGGYHASSTADVAGAQVLEAMSTAEPPVFWNAGSFKDVHENQSKEVRREGMMRPNMPAGYADGMSGLPPVVNGEVLNPY